MTVLTMLLIFSETFSGGRCGGALHHGGDHGSAYAKDHEIEKRVRRLKTPSPFWHLNVSDFGIDAFVLPVSCTRENKSGGARVAYISSPCGVLLHIAAAAVLIGRPDSQYSL